MKKQYFILAALAVTMFAGCSSDDFVAEAPPANEAATEVPIVFSSINRPMTRADITGKSAADLLGNQFVVTGYKGDKTATVGSVVFDNYVVKYYDNTANTTESNSHNWEYVNQTPIKHATDNGITRQTIKYWDYTQSQYDFIAWSTGSKTPVYEGTPGDGEVLVSAITPTTATGASGVAYTFEGTAADLDDCYIADLVTVKKDGTTPSKYQEPVTLRFRSLGSKVRIGIYETIPGYSVKDVKFYTAAATALPDDPTKPRLFTTTDGQIYTKGKYTVYYPTVDATTNADNNQVHVKFEGTGSQETKVEFSTLQYTTPEDGEKTKGNVFLGRTSNTASMAGEAEGNYYTQYLPNESGTNLNLRVDYTLESIDGSGEVITVRGATAQVPSIYTQWKAGYAYTYLFKISDKTNGYTGVYDPTNPNGNTTDSNPAGLYPITFDAVVVNAEEDATQETITLVSAPSITTYQQGSTVVNSNEYVAATGKIYVTVNESTTDASPDLPNGALVTLTDKASLYTVAEGTTEAEVIDALQMQDDDIPSGVTIRGRNKVELTAAVITLTNKVEFGADDNAISVGTDQAAKFTPAAGTYAFVYTKTAATADNDEVKYQPVAFGDANVTTKYRYDLKDATAGDVEKGVLYFESTTGTYAKKDVFLGQNVNNLFTRSGAGTEQDPYVYTEASGLSVTGTQYYYGIDHKAAHGVAYATDVSGLGLYEADGNGYKLTDDTKIQDDKAYYYKETDGSYTYCVFYPEQPTGLKVLDTTKYVQATEGTAIDGMTYFDKYTKNDGVYYAKVIKVQ